MRSPAVDGEAGALHAKLADLDLDAQTQASEIRLPHGQLKLRVNRSSITSNTGHTPALRVHTIAILRQLQVPRC